MKTLIKRQNGSILSRQTCAKLALELAKASVKQSTIVIYNSRVIELEISSQYGSTGIYKNHH